MANRIKLELPTGLNRNHPPDLTGICILGAKQRDDTMVKQYLDLHIKNFGLSHPRTFEIKHFLDKENLSLP
jgi:hypothetical protein